jgi:ABC-type branched-subunit amino acid transport system substrate-binding protein
MYEKGEKNFREALGRLHERKVEIIFEKRALEEGNLPEEGEDKRVEVDSVFMADSAVEVGALFLPGYPEEIAMLAPQVPFYKIHTQLLGATGWYDVSVVKNAGRYVEGGIVVVDFTDPSNSKLWQSFQGKYNLHYKETPDAKVALGYDAAKFLLQHLEDGGSEKLLRRLSDVDEFDGASARYRFSRNTHANTSAVLLKIVDEEFHKIYP